MSSPVEFQRQRFGIELENRALVPLAANHKLKRLGQGSVRRTKIGSPRTLIGVTGFEGERVAARARENRICEDVRVRISDVRKTPRHAIRMGPATLQSRTTQAAATVACMTSTWHAGHRGFSASYVGTILLLLSSHSSRGRSRRSSAWRPALFGTGHHQPSSD